MTSERQTTPPHTRPDVRLAASIADIENAMRQVDCLKGDGFPHSVEVVIGQQLAHFFNLGQQVSHALILDLKQELQRIEAKVDMLNIDFREERRKSETLERRLEAMRGV